MRWRSLRRKQCSLKPPGMSITFDCEGPVQAEIFVVWLNGDHLELTGPCGAAPWYMEVGATEHPVEVVNQLVRNALGSPRLVHSTSWRRDRDAVIFKDLLGLLDDLAFFVVIAGRHIDGGVVAEQIEGIRIFHHLRRIVLAVQIGAGGKLQLFHQGRAAAGRRLIGGDDQAADRVAPVQRP